MAQTQDEQLAAIAEDAAAARANTEEILRMLRSGEATVAHAPATPRPTGATDSTGRGVGHRH